MLTGSQIDLGEDCSSIQLVDYIIHGGSDVAFTLNGSVGLSHVDTDSNLVQILWLGWRHDGGDPWRMAFDCLDDVIILKPFELFLDLLSDVKGHLPMWLTDWVNVSVEVKLYLKVFQHANAFE